MQFTGKEASDYLSQNSEGRSLMQAINAARFELTRQEAGLGGDERGGYVATNAKHNFSASFEADNEVKVRANGEHRWQIGLRLKSYGYGQQLVEAPPMVSRHVSGNRIEYKRESSASFQLATQPLRKLEARATLTEWYVNTAGGLEQGFTLPAPPRKESGETTSRGEPLRLVMEWTGDLHGELTEDGQTVLLKDAKGQPLATYDHLKAWDATGRNLAAQMHVSGHEVSLEINDTGAKYPVTIDPTFGQKQFQLKADDGQQQDSFGYSVAIDGNTAVVGAVGFGNAYRGYAYVFVWNGTTWSQQQKLKDDAGVASDHFGKSVGISGDTIIIGAVGVDLSPGIDPNDGAAYIYTRSGSTWTLKQVLTASDAHAGAGFGNSVAISGNAAIVGSSSGGYVFERIGATWSERRILFPENGATEAFPVAISGDTIMFSGSEPAIPGQSTRQGAVYFFRRTGATWLHPLVQQKVLSGDYVDGDRFGNSVAISGDTAIVGYYHLSGDASLRSTKQGAYIYVRNDGTWSQQQKLAPGAAQPTSGQTGEPSVGVSGNTAIVGFPHETVAGNLDQGSAYIYVRTGSAWAPTPTEQLGASGGAADDRFGNSVAISGDNAIIGAELDDVGVNSAQGSAYIFARPPDSDGDALPDEWEKNGITVDSAGRVVGTGNLVGQGTFINLKEMGANPMHKDIFIHADWMLPDPARSPAAIFKPGPKALRLVIDAFAIAPAEQVNNPDHKRGITLHIDAGADSIMNPVTGQKWGSRSKADQGIAFQAVTGGNDASGKYIWSGAFDTIKAVNFDPSGRAAVFHYMLFCNTYPGFVPDSSGLSRGKPGADFFVSLGHPNWTKSTATSIGTPMEQAGTFMHELGHNLGLKHGGFEDEPEHKPNYLSVMNYTYQTIGLLNANGQRSFDYSRAKLPQLNENNLDENVGIQDPARHYSVWVCPYPPGTIDDPYYRKFLPSQALDWNLNDVRETGLTVDITCDKSPTYSTLVGFKDWPELVFTGSGRIGNPAGAGAPEQMVTPHDEPSREELLSAVPPNLIEEEAIAPQDVVTLSTDTGPAPLAINFDGAASTAVNGTIVKWEWDFGDGTTGSGATVNHTYNTPGDYFASLNVTDSAGRVNLVPLLNLVTVTGAPSPTPTPTPTNEPNLTSYQPPGWTDKIVVSNVTGTNADSIPLKATDTLYVDWAAINNGGAPTTGGFSVELYVDGVVKQTFPISATIDPDGFFGVQDYVIGSLSAGQHTVRIVLDESGLIAESNEADNEYTKTITVGSSPTPTPTPVVTPTPTPTPSASPTPTSSGTPTPTPTTTPAGPLPGRRITKVADTADGFPGELSVTTINNSRTLVFVAQRSSGYIGLFSKTADGPLQDVADFNALGGSPDGLWTINEAGQVGFMVRPGNFGFPGASDRFTIYRSDSGVVTKLAETTPSGPAGTFQTFSVTFVSINDSGTVSFWAQLNGGGTAISRVDSGGILSTAVDTKSGAFTGLFAGARMNQSGVIAFGASTPTGLGIFTVAPDGTLSTIATRPSEFDGLDFNPAINSSGTVAFLGETKTIRGVFTGKGGALTTIAQATREFGTDPFLDFTGGVVAINDAGTVVFKARLRSAPENGGIFTGPNYVAGKIDPTAVDKVIAIGDSLFGSTVENLYFNGALNQNGDIAFSYDLKNRISGVAFASPPPTGLANISTRLRVQPGDNALFGGFIITGTEPKKVLLRAIAPSLSVSGKLEDPTIELFNSSGQVIRTNDNWGDSDNKEAIIASTIPPGHNLESAILVNLDPGAYTAIVRGVNNTTGIGVVEAYDLDRTADSKLANISTRGVVETGDDVMIGGFIIVGSKLQKVIVRAIGPSLSIEGKLADPTLELRDSNGELIASNNNWRMDQEAEIISTTIPPSNEAESAIVRTLSPAPYTAIVRGVGDTTGIAVVEVYALE